MRNEDEPTSYRVCEANKQVKVKLRCEEWDTQVRLSHLEGSVRWAGSVTWPSFSSHFRPGETRAQDPAVAAAAAARARDKRTVNNAAHSSAIHPSVWSQNIVHGHG